MFGFTRATSDATWKSVEDDFLLGTCSRRIFGFASRSADGTWSAFDDEARPLGAFARLEDVKSLLTHAHREAHDAVCASARDSRSRPAAPRSPRPVSPDPARHALAQPASW